jgi:hypothetical protein
MRPPNRAPLSPELILRLQTAVGNRAVLRLIERARSNEQSSPVPEPEPHRPPGWWRRHFGWIAAAWRILRRVRVKSRER